MSLRWIPEVQWTDWPVWIVQYLKKPWDGYGWIAHDRSIRWPGLFGVKFPSHFHLQKLPKIHF